ncbi:flagellar biosynthesis protein FliR [Roseibium denhamense]|uniref:Flagellar biosynthetic protein FliR n=1 Tax=Roseibium denhamense TaxID=76305 RepID=A0ABY1PGY6_9HYPH|nr:flagellar biosynthesis protein FliR [Roseibium denhamense]MTI06233.1 flagellar biosynthesis protein FliR [Roseibium denhamense]SMP32719.1 flagellar biosynthetic protein FliR [Roseibium denhamense]
MLPASLLSVIGTEVLLAVFLLFCRIGGCLMIIPGFGSTRIPAQVRLLISLAVTLALAPLLAPTIQAALPDETLSSVSWFIGAELLTGVFIGFLGRIFIAALETLTTLVSMAIGLSNMPGMPVEGVDALPPVASLFTLTATAMVFISNQHWEVIRGLVASYEAIPAGQPLAAMASLEQFTDQMAKTFVLALRVCSPFIVYTIVVNLAVGLVNKLTPQIPVYFISLPFVIAGGLYFLYLVIAEAMMIFLDGYFTWLQLG